ncbi:MAG: hypothetical protein LBJ73_03540 [Rickettsiales bacterium]|jgi:hypothetical protein|nr:hypothetical protein [Rickettsiales bacterium]
MLIPLLKFFLQGQKWTHIKVMNPSEKLLSELNISELPALVFWRDGKIIGDVQGYFENIDSEKGLLLKKVKGFKICDLRI